MPYQRLRAVLTAGVLLMLLTVCDAVSPSDTSSDLHISLINDSSRDAQVLGPGEQPDPARVLAPTKSREITIKDVKEGDVFRFRALIFEESIGGAWLEVANQACLYDAERKEARIVSYRGGIALVCENW